MKNTFHLFTLCALVILTSCAKSSPNKSTDSNTQEKLSIEEKSTEQYEIKNSEKKEAHTSDAPTNILNNYDCYSCHKDNEQLIGPSFKTIVERNSQKTNAADYLAEKIKKGSVGVFGQIPMQPHNFIPDREIEQICEYILNLK